MAITISDEYDTNYQEAAKKAWDMYSLSRKPEPGDLHYRIIGVIEDNCKEYSVNL